MIGGLLKGAGAASAIGNVLFGDSGAVVLGKVTFTGMEVPASLKWGVRQTVVTHRFPGGTRHIDVMGRDDLPLAWSGILMGANAGDRATLLHEMCVAGKPVALSWNDRAYNVVVQEFTCEDVAFRGNYSISCVVLKDTASDPGKKRTSLLGSIIGVVNKVMAIVTPVMSAIGLVQAIASDLSYTAPASPKVASPADVDDASADIAAVQTAAQQSAGDMSVGAPDAAALMAGVAVARVQLAAIGAAADASLDAIAAAQAFAHGGGAGSNSGIVTPGDNILGSADPGEAAGTLIAALSQSAAAAAAHMGAALLGTAAANLSATPGDADAAVTFDLDAPPVDAQAGGQSVTVIGGNLFAVAADALGDATQWFRVALASGLTDPMLTGTVALSIPRPIEAISDGVPAIYGATVI